MGCGQTWACPGGEADNLSDVRWVRSVEGGQTVMHTHGLSQNLETGAFEKPPFLLTESANQPSQRMVPAPRTEWPGERDREASGNGQPVSDLGAWQESPHPPDSSGTTSYGI